MINTKRNCVNAWKLCSNAKIFLHNKTEHTKPEPVCCGPDKFSCLSCVSWEEIFEFPNSVLVLLGQIKIALDISQFNCRQL